MTLTKEQQAQLAEAADDLEALQLALHGGPHDGQRVTLCLAVAVMRMSAGLEADPLKHMDRLRHQADSTKAERDSLRALWVEWLDGLYDGPDLLRRVKLAVHGPLRNPHGVAEARDRTFPPSHVVGPGNPESGSGG